MIKSKVLACAVMMGALPGAAPLPTAQAVVEWKHGAEETIIVDDTLWHCRESTCAGQLVESISSMARACFQVSRYAGFVQSFGTNGLALNEQQLLRCNRGKSSGGARQR
jgi:hypothetical protein